eukprot:4954160-Alexandrium_andersonii.AAC.1
MAARAMHCPKAWAFCAYSRADIAGLARQRRDDDQQIQAAIVEVIEKRAARESGPWNTQEASEDATKGRPGEAK